MRVLATSILMVVVSLSHARADDYRLVEAQSAFDEHEHEKTLALLAPILADASVGAHERAVALRLAGCAEVVLGHRDEASAHFTESFALEPDSPLEPSLAQSPDASSVFELARGQWRAALATEMDAKAADIAQLKLSVAAPQAARGGAAIEIGVALTDPGKLVSRIELAYRRRGEAAFARLVEQPKPDVRFAIPREVTASRHPFVLEYRVTLRHETGFDLAHDGTLDRPRQIAVSAGHDAKWHESWWVRGAIAAGVIGLGAGGYLVFRSPDVGPQHVVVK